ncbi:MAG: YkvA family protein [Roseiflexaceae bacterium]|nr:YkvA family protein [Roseiflexaceae bacterium]
MKQRTLTRVGAVIGIVIGVLYLLNPTAGLLELIPDVIPIVGNLDEAAATTLVLWGLQAFRKPDDPPALPIPNKK